jgi:capsule polysaccharide export protein KpsE/RkpR
MNFSDRMRELLEQGAQFSKEFASKAGEKAQDLGEKSYRASKDFVAKAGAKVQDLGERGVLMLEIRQQEAQAQKCLGRLGTEVYHSFAERGAKSITPDTPAVKTILAEIASLRESIEKREEELERRKGPQTP